MTSAQGLQLWHNARLVTLADDTSWGMLEDGALVVEGRQLAWVGSAKALPAALRARVVKEHDLHGALVTPGLVHATHATPAEIDTVAKSGAGIVLCPGTEANLGDGIPDLPAWLAARVPIAIGSDSQVIRNWPEELRWLEYAQRLTLRQRNVAAAAQQPATAARLIEAALVGGARSAGQTRWGLIAGARADALVLDAQAPALLGIEPAQRLDALVFASGEPALAEVLVAGETVLRNGRHAHEDAVATRFVQAMDALWNAAPARNTVSRP